MNERETTRQDRNVDRAVDALRAAPVPPGPPAEAILNLAEVREIDLIIMGTRGLSRLAGVLLGSESQKVISHADCPVMLAR